MGRISISRLRKTACIHHDSASLARAMARTAKKCHGVEHVGSEIFRIGQLERVDPTDAALFSRVTYLGG